MFDVLLVEDNEADVLLVHEALDGFTPPVRLHVVPDGEQALAYLLRDAPYQGAVRPRLVLLDSNTPRRSALEVLAELRATPDFTALPVLVFSSSSAPADAQRSLEAGANGYVAKPLGLDEFMQVVQDTLHTWMEKLTWGGVPLERENPRA